MQRYDLVHYPCRAYNADVMEVCDDGDYVLFADHQAAIADKEQEYKSLLEHHEVQTEEFQAALSAVEEEIKMLRNILKQVAPWHSILQESDNK